MSEETPNVRLDPAKQRFVLEVDGEYAGLAQFVERGDAWVFTHTVVDDRFEGRGFASRLVRAALDGARDAGRRIVPICPFVSAYLGKHDDWADLVDQPSDELHTSLLD
ncbi:MAG: family acetyltransferase [Naasia sp.]|uniref:GNAT family N-acetyltransferase n=1 Tax=Naasia sp. TaxID=2546198 RepID=UPI0026017167|nr:GNAT family N-acetyltransferase [Naasia sp.]MCU1570558.1 family acetyltransferase [Naasia sp.]